MNFFMNIVDLVDILKLHSQGGENPGAEVLDIPGRECGCSTVNASRSLICVSRKASRNTAVEVSWVSW